MSTKDSDFTSVLITAVEDRKQREEVRKEEKERQRQYELELARIQSQSNVVEVKIYHYLKITLRENFISQN
ncbi:hypothetical protein TNCV_699061 [Trichonephila clavipes]|nr:hypothetical protein TNCV_699061 [Trichonephila clavipes]